VEGFHAGLVALHVAQITEFVVTIVEAHDGEEVDVVRRREQEGDEARTKEQREI
jgi:hypothetical protein